MRITESPAFDESKIATARRTLRFYGIADFTRLLVRFAAAKLRRLRPDVIVSVAAPEIFKEELLASARVGCGNLHSGRLPKYRGMMPTFWQMLHTSILGRSTRISCA